MYVKWQKVKRKKKADGNNKDNLNKNEKKQNQCLN